MAKKAVKKQVGFEEGLWDSANKLSGSVEPSEYKHVVLYRFPIEKIPAGRQKEVSVCSENRIFLKNQVVLKKLCFRSMAIWY